MIIHIAPIGIETEHVIQWLKEVIPVEKVWLIHSKVGKIDFEKKAKELEKRIKSFYEDCEVKRKIINDPFNLDDTMDKIDEIVKEEEEENPDILRQNFVINVTGGTNAMAAASIISAMLLGAKAHYVKDKRQNPTARKFVTELPIPPIGLAKMNETQQKVLQEIANGYFVLKYPDGKIVSKRGPGVITNNGALEKMGWDKQINTGKRVRRLGATNMRSIAKKLEHLGYIKIIKGIPQFKKVSLGYEKYEWKEGINEAEVMYEITPLGRRQAKNSIMLDDSK
ncbi:MAG: HFX_2341 family transcriptional regulator domain-containing protein [Nitrosotalea sp.]